MHKLVTVAEMQSVEQEANANGLTYGEMMENAGLGVAEVVLKTCSDLKEGGVLGLVGSGNNGGDTLVALTHLAKQGWKANAYVMRERPPSDPLIVRLKESGGRVFFSAEDSRFNQLEKLLGDQRVLLDGVLGTGIKLPLKKKLAEALGKAKQIIRNMSVPPRIVAVDCPSGIDLQSGEVSPECIPADITVTMAAVKVGLLSFPANKYVGDLYVVGIGLTEDDPRSETWRGIQRFMADGAWVSYVLPPRPSDAHKGTFGTVMVVAGSVNFTGAAVLAGKAAFRCGVGLVCMAVPSPLHTALSGHFVEATWLLLPHELGVIAEDAAEVVFENLGRTTAMLLGPGFGLEETTKDFLARLIGLPQKTGKGKIGFIPTAESSEEHRKELPPLVLDADGLKLLSQIPNWSAMLPPPAILTPHPGEMSIMTGLSIHEIQKDRIGVAEKYAREWGHVVVLKGANTVVASPDGRTVVIPVATAALARGGTGDVLSGAIAGLRAQGIEAFESAVAGCWIHAQAGLYAAKTLGSTAPLLAGDVLNAVAPIVSELYAPRKKMWEMEE